MCTLTMLPKYYFSSIQTICLNTQNLKYHSLPDQNTKVNISTSIYQNTNLKIKILIISKKLSLYFKNSVYIYELQNVKMYIEI